jgi:ABC-type transporter MlaC component
MSFPDPQVVTVNAVAKSMPRISSEGTKSLYQTADELFKMTISHTKSGDRIRSMVRVDQRAVVADPLTSVNDYENLGFYCVLDRPIYGFTMAQIEQLIAGFKTWLDNTAIDRIVGSES